MPDPPPPRRIPVPDTAYAIRVTGQAASIRLAVVDWLDQPVPALTLADARRVGLALINAAIESDDWPPQALQPDTTTEVQP